MMPYGWHDGGWGIVWMVLSWAAIVGSIWVVIRSFASGEDRRDPAKAPRDVLAERFARGEIDAEEYHERLRVLQEPRAPAGRR